MLSVPSRPWESVSIDMIMSLPLSANGDSKAYDAMLVVVDHFTKMAKYFPVQKTLVAAKLADLFHKRIVCSFGMPWSIISDRGSIFMS